MNDPSGRARKTALTSYDILQTSAEPGYDDLVALATQICDTPVGLISFVSSDRQWFKARIGFAPCETPLSQSVCAHALAEGDILIIPDLTLDPRTRDNTLVTGEPFIRFYAGAVLKAANGVAIGTLCVIDTVPRPDGLTPQQRSGLQALARQVMSQLELRRAIGERDRALTLSDEARDALQVSEERFRLSSRATTDVMWDWDREGDTFHWDDALTRVYGHVASIVAPTAAWWFERIHPEDRERVRRRVLGAHEAGSRWADAYRFQRADGSYADVLNQAFLIRNKAGRVVRMTGVMLDNSARVAADEHQTLLNHELSHRLKNTLAMVQAIAAQTLRNAASLDDARDALLRRLIALGKAHDILLASNTEQAGMESVIRGALALHDNQQAGRFRIEGPALEIGPKAALALALMIHELATNAAKYGSLSTETGHVGIRWRIEEADDAPQVRLGWTEEGGPPVTTPTRAGFGTRLIERGLAGTIGGVVKLAYHPSGVVCDLVAPLAGFQEKVEILN